MCVMPSDPSAVGRPSSEPITLTVDEVTVLLGLLGVLSEDHADDDIGAVADRTAGRLRERLGFATG